MPDIQFTPTNGNGVIYVRRESDIPANPDPSIVYMLWDGVDYRTAVRYEVSGGAIGRDGPVVGYTTATLPDPSSLPNGWCVGVADYNGNIATVVNGGWKFNFPFKTNWSARPPASIVPIGTELIATDYANQKWISDGAYWRPAQGRALLTSKASGAAGFIAQLSGATAGVFAVAGNKIPAGMIPPEGRILVTSDGFKTGGAATYRLRTHLGLLNNASDPEVTSVVSLSPTGSPFAMSTSARFGPETGRFSSRGGLGEGASSTGGFTLSSKDTGLNTNSDMFVNIAAAEGNIADVYNLVNLQIWLEA